MLQKLQSYAFAYLQTSGLAVFHSNGFSPSAKLLSLDFYFKYYGAFIFSVHPFTYLFGTIPFFRQELYDNIIKEYKSYFIHKWKEIIL